MLLRCCLIHITISILRHFIFGSVQSYFEAGIPKIPNSEPQTLKCADFWCNLSSQLVVADSRERCFQLFKMQNSQKFPGLRPWTPCRIYVFYFFFFNLICIVNSHITSLKLTHVFFCTLFLEYHLLFLDGNVDEESE